MCPANESPDSNRRGFFKRASSVVIGVVVTVVPLAAGLVTMFDPLRRRSKTGGLIRVTSLNALPKDGVPRKFPVIASRTDAWNKFPQVPIGAVYLRRTTDQAVDAFNVVCPHAGCFVEYKADQKFYLCPCHNSAFSLGGVQDSKSPSPRGLDRLETEIRDGDIWVRFQNFRAGEKRRIPEA